MRYAVLALAACAAAGPLRTKFWSAPGSLQGRNLAVARRSASYLTRRHGEKWEETSEEDEEVDDEPSEED